MTRQGDMRPEATGKLTYADYLLLPEDGRRHEVIDGEHYVTASPVTRHQRILRKLSFELETWLRHHPAGEMFFAPVDVVMSDTDVVVPDLIYVSHERAAHVQARGVFGAPDLVIEILSPATRRTDELVKRALYERAGVIEYWIVDPTLDVVKVFCRVNERFAPPVELSREAGDVLTTPLLPGLVLALREVLA